ncbi:MAG: hypothetical protein V4850_36575 [Myxococcota bacterium]
MFTPLLLLVACTTGAEGPSTPEPVVEPAWEPPACEGLVRPRTFVDTADVVQLGEMLRVFPQNEERDALASMSYGGDDLTLPGACPAVLADQPLTGITTIAATGGCTAASSATYAGALTWLGEAGADTSFTRVEADDWAVFADGVELAIDGTFHREYGPTRWSASASGSFRTTRTDGPGSEDDGVRPVDLTATWERACTIDGGCAGHGVFSVAAGGRDAGDFCWDQLGTAEGGVYPSVTVLTGANEARIVVYGTDACHGVYIDGVEVGEWCAMP